MYTNPNPNLTPQCQARKYGQTDGRTDDRGYNIIQPFGRIKKDAPFVAFYDMHAVTFVLPDKWQMCRLRDCSGLFLYRNKTTWSLTGQVISIPNSIYIEKKI